MNRILPRFYRARERAEWEARLGEIMLETGAALPVERDPFAVPNDPEALRGIPAVGGRGSLGGAIRGTRPGDGLA